MSEHLPIFVSQEELQENPGFAALLQDLATNHITKDGISKEKAKKLDQCTIALQRERKYYLQALLYYTAINDLLLDYKLNTTDASPEDTKLFDMLSRALNTAEASMVLSDSSNSCRMSAQSLREFQIGNEEAIKQQVKILGASLVPKLEAYMEEKCMALADFYEPASTQQKRELQVAKGIQLAEVVANKKQHNALLAQTVQNDVLHNKHSFWEYYKALEGVITKLHTLITTYKLREPNNDSTPTDPFVLTAEGQRIKLETSKLKLEVLARQLDRETYGQRDNVNPIEGLKVIAQHLARAVNQARSLHEKAVARKSQYEAIGMGFPQLAAEYGKLLKEIADKEFVIAELDRPQ